MSFDQDATRASMDDEMLRSIEEELFKSWNFEIQPGVYQLLEAIHKTKDLLQGVLTCIREKYDLQRKYIVQDKGISEKEKKFQEARKSWRDNRINLYDKLLLLSLGGAGAGWEQWDTSTPRSSHPSAEKFYEDRIESDFAPGSLHKYLLDHIHEKDDIMLKYYRNKKYSEQGDQMGYREILEKKAFWLAQSMKRYCMQLIDPTLQQLSDWKGKKERLPQGELLSQAKEEFKNRVLSPDGKWSWKYRARMYWLLARAKTAAICTLIPLLVQEIIAEDYEVLFQDDSDLPSDKKVLNPDGVLRYSSLLAYASSKNDYDLVFSMLQSKKQIGKSVRYVKGREEKWKKVLADALWNATYKGHDQIVQALLECTQLYPSQYYYDNEMVPPLHVAVRREFSLVVKAFCAESEKQKTINCQERDYRNPKTPSHPKTPLQVAIELRLEDIKKLLLQTPQVQQAMEESYRKRDLIVNSANAIMVGAALIAGVSFGGWLQPPLGYHTYYQFTEPLPAPPDTYDSYLFVQGRTSIRVFAISNSISFFFAIASMVAGMATVMAATMEATKEESYIENTVQSLLVKLRVTTSLFVVSVILVLIAFSSAAIAILPPIKLYQRDMKITIAVGGFFCLMVVGMMLFEILRMTRKLKISDLFLKAHGPSSEGRSSPSSSTS